MERTLTPRLSICVITVLIGIALTYTAGYQTLSTTMILATTDADCIPCVGS